MKHYGCPATFGAPRACVSLRCAARLDLGLGLGLAVPCMRRALALRRALGLGPGLGACGSIRVRE